MFNRIIIVKIMKTIMRIVIIDFFINKNRIREIKDCIKIRNRIKIKDLRKCRLLKFLKKRILMISLTRIMISKIIIEILIINFFIYIIKTRNNFTMRMKKLLLKKKRF